MRKSGKKFDQEKARWDLLPLGPIKEAVEVMTLGVKKYGVNNWQHVKGGINRYYAALWRHLEAWRMGERFDQESGKRHLAHALCCLLFIMCIDTFKENKNKARRK